MSPITLLLFALTLDARTGAEIERHRVPDSPSYETVEACQTAQVATGTQKPVDGTITVYSCVLLRGDQQT
jgi:hypothetical protein